MITTKTGNPKNACMGGYGKSLDVKLTNECNCFCEFCIESNGYRPPLVSVSKLIEATCESGMKSVLILGGEPFLSPNLLPYVRGISLKIEKIYVTTNGSSFSEKIDNELAKYIDGLNISINSPKESKNAEVYGRKIDFNEIKTAIKRYRDQNVYVRINANLVKGYIDNFKTIKKTISLAESWGVDEIRFNELQGDNNADVFVDSKKIFSELNADPFLDGCTQELEIPSTIKITIKQVCHHCNHLKSKPSQTYKPLSYHSIKVMYCNGKIYDGWITQTPDKSIGHNVDCHTVVSDGCHPINKFIGSDCHPSSRFVLSGCRRNTKSSECH